MTDVLLCGAAASPERLPSGRWPPALYEPRLESFPSSELLSEPGSSPPGSAHTQSAGQDTIIYTSFYLFYQEILDS